MKKASTLLAIVLALLMLTPVVSPLATVVLAEDNGNTGLEISDSYVEEIVEPTDVEPAEPIEINDDKLKLEVSELKSDIQTAVSSVEDIEPASEEDKEVLDKFHEAASDLNRELEVSAATIQSEAVGESIYDLTTIPVRIQLLIRIGRAIRFSSTELANKVVAAHTKMTEYILVGILYVLNPFASEGQIMEYIDRFEPLAEELLAYPDLQPHDIATIWKKSAFSRELNEARRVYRGCNEATRRFRAKPLKDCIDEGSRMWWRIDVTCGELDEHVEKLHEQMEKITGPKIRVERIEFMEGNAGYIAADKKTKIRPVIFPNEVKNKDYIMYTSNPYIAIVSGGEIIPVKPGNVFITVVAKDNGVKAEFELTIVEPGGYLDGIPPLHPTGRNTEYWNKPKPGDPDITPPISRDQDKVKSLSFLKDRYTLVEGEGFEASENIVVYPENAKNIDLEYWSTDESVIEVDPVTGVLTALKPGRAGLYVKLRSDSTIYTSTNIIVEAKPEEVVFEIEELTNSERKAGIFSVTAIVTRNGNPYNGKVEFRVRADDRVITKYIQAKNGKAVAKFNGFEFGVWRKNFEAEAIVGEERASISFSFK
ncbi:MAG: CAMP factor family pore-forming toxin [Firmicutes bacterium]|nr:CAMP factor family pore-forming toxin [Bacillota bacterium]